MAIRRPFERPYDDSYTWDGEEFEPTEPSPTLQTRRITEGDRQCHCVFDICVTNLGIGVVPSDVV